MYKLKENVELDFDGRKKTYIAQKVGITLTTLIAITKHHKPCSKPLAYYLTKLQNEDAEIEDYFEYVEKGK